jgi:hypothetical protein
MNFKKNLVRSFYREVGYSPFSPPRSRTIRIDLLRRTIPGGDTIGKAVGWISL